MTQQVKLRTRVYSDTNVRNPEAYYNSVFFDYKDQWHLLNSDEPNCILVETRTTYDFHPDELDQLDDLYDAITPEMYQSTSRSYYITSN